MNQTTDNVSEDTPRTLDELRSDALRALYQRLLRDASDVDALGLNGLAAAIKTVSDSYA